MTLARFKDLSIDAVDPHRLARQWSAFLGRDLELFDDGDAALRGHALQQTVWINRVPEAKTVKHRVHLDLRTPSLEFFDGLEVVPVGPDDRWTTFRDVEGGELCVFVQDEVPGELLKDVVVDAVDHERIGHWWADVLGGELQSHDGWVNLDGIPGFPYESFDFGTVPEPKTVKNRIHWDVTLEPGVAPEDLVSLGATNLRDRDDRIAWTVMADPEGNEFCVHLA